MRMVWMRRFTSACMALTYHAGRQLLPGCPQSGPEQRGFLPLIGRQHHEGCGESEWVKLWVAQEITMPVTQEEVLTALKDCHDPEIPVNIVDLGLIYNVALTPAV